MDVGSLTVPNLASSCWFVFSSCLPCFILYIWYLFVVLCLIGILQFSDFCSFILILQIILFKLFCLWLFHFLSQLVCLKSWFLVLSPLLALIKNAHDYVNLSREWGGSICGFYIQMHTVPPLGPSWWKQASPLSASLKHVEGTELEMWRKELAMRQTPLSSEKKVRINYRSCLRMFMQPYFLVSVVLLSSSCEICWSRTCCILNTEWQEQTECACAVDKPGLGERDREGERFVLPVPEFLVNTQEGRAAGGRNKAPQ